MNRKSLFGRLRVRTSLIIVLVFFFFMLLAGALLGVLSLKLNNDSLGEIMDDNQAVQSMSETMYQYHEIQVLLGRAMASFVINSDLQNNMILAEWGADDDAQQSSISEESRQLLDQSQQQLEKVRAALQEFRRLSSADMEANPDQQSLYATAQQLVDTVLPELIAFLRLGQIDQYDQFVREKVIPLERRLEHDFRAIAKRQGDITQSAVDAQESHLQLVVAIVVVSMFFALLFSLGAFVFLQRIVLRPLLKAGEHFDRIAAGDLTADIVVPSGNEIGVLYMAMQRMQASLVRMVSTVRAGVGEIRTGSQEIFAGNTDLSSRTEQQAASLQQTAASMEQLASTVRQNSDNAEQANRLAQGAADVAVRGGQAVSSVSETMSGITESSDKIGAIVNVIDGIAFQTNILALNAAVEAARAGEQGRGFAVVAGEVRALAQRSAQAAQEIKLLIEDSVGRVREGSDRVRDAANVMDEIVQSIQGVTAIMNEISSASREQTDGIAQINMAVADMDSVVQQNSALVQQAASAAGSLQDQAEYLSQSVAAFRLHQDAGAGHAGHTMGYDAGRSQVLALTLDHD